MTATVLQSLRISFPGAARPVVDGVSLEIAPGECLALVGASGAGKSLTGRSLLGLVPRPARVELDRLVVAGREATMLGERGWRRLRGSAVGLIDQDALVSLDPLRRIGREVAEPIEVHELRLARPDVRKRMIAALEAASMPDAASRARQYPHELSGGLRQRALIASALAGRPDLLVADEPTTALDATVQARVLDELAGLRDAGLAILLISHDLRAVARVADRVAVLADGRVVEEAPAALLLDAPRHPVSRELIALPAPRPPRELAPAASPVLEARELSKSYRRPDGSLQPAVSGVGFTLAAGAALGIVGESGSGKSTLARMLLALERPDAGDVLLDGKPWAAEREAARRVRRARIQLIDQDPFGSLDPRLTVRRILGEAVRLDAGVPPDRRLRDARARDLLARVGLGGEFLGRMPRELSGGQRQRVAIARALARSPGVLVCDEPVSALDAATRTQVLGLLDELRADLGLAIVLVSHDLSVIERVCDDVLVMRNGEVVERGPVSHVLRDPSHPFTRELVAVASVRPGGATRRP